MLSRGSAQRAGRADTVLGAGYTQVPFWPRCRGPMETNDVLDFINPVIEGLVWGDALSWSIDNARLNGITFKIEERG